LTSFPLFRDIDIGLNDFVLEKSLITCHGDDDVSTDEEVMKNAKNRALAD
jgi:hypothetical protein